MQSTVAELYAGPHEEIFLKKTTESSQEAVFLGLSAILSTYFCFVRVSRLRVALQNGKKYPIRACKNTELEVFLEA